MDIQKLIEILIQLRSESLQLGSNPTDNEIMALMNKYNMLFVGKDINCINSNELCHTLKNYFHIEIDNDKLNSLIPKACQYLNMKYDPLVEVSKLGKTSEPDCYSIILW